MDIQKKHKSNTSLECLEKRVWFRSRMIRLILPAYYALIVNLKKNFRNNSKQIKGL